MTIYLYLNTRIRFSTPKKWYKTCVTLIYYNLKEMRYHEKSKLAAILDLGTVVFDWLID